MFLLSSQKGFTLLEILIALFIFSIVSVIMMTGLHTVMNSQAATEKKAAELTQLQIAILLFSRDIEQVRNRPITNAKNILEPPLAGETDYIAFTHSGFANPLGQLARSTLQRVAYSRKNNGDFIRTTWSVLDQTQKTFPLERVLLHNLKQLRFEYLDNQNKFQNKWPPPSSQNSNPNLNFNSHSTQTQDPKTSTFPRAIRIKMEFKNGDALSQLYPLNLSSINLAGQPIAQTIQTH